MKPFFLIPLFAIFISFESCNPSAGKELVTEVVKLKATLSNTNENILLGDTLKIILKLPDTISSNLKTQVVQSFQRGFYAMQISREDTLNRKSILIRPPHYWTTKGTTEGNFSFVMNTNAKPYEVIISIKPPEKGLYLLEVIPQPGVLKVNNTEANLVVGFDVADKHYIILSIIAPYFGGQAFYDAFIKKDEVGFGTYLFRVN